MRLLQIYYVKQRWSKPHPCQRKTHKPKLFNIKFRGLYNCPSQVTRITNFMLNSPTGKRTASRVGFYQNRNGFDVLCIKNEAKYIPKFKIASFRSG